MTPIPSHHRRSIRFVLLAAGLVPSLWTRTLPIAVLDLPLSVGIYGFMISHHAAFEGYRSSLEHGRRWPASDPAEPGMYAHAHAREARCLRASSCDVHVLHPHALICLHVSLQLRQYDAEHL